MFVCLLFGTFYVDTSQTRRVCVFFCAFGRLFSLNYLVSCKKLDCIFCYYTTPRKLTCPSPQRGTFLKNMSSSNYQFSGDNVSLPKTQLYIDMAKKGYPTISHILDLLLLCLEEIPKNIDSQMFGQRW